MSGVAVGAKEKVNIDITPKRSVFWPDGYHNPQTDLDKQLGQDVTEFLQIDDDGDQLLLTVSFNTRDEAVGKKNSGWEINGEPASIMDVYKNIFDHDRSGTEVDEKTLEKFRVGVVELKLPIVAAGYLAGKEGMTVEQMKKDYQPGIDVKARPKVVKLTGPSRAGKSQFLAIEAYKGNIAVVASEPFSDYGFNNYLRVLQEYGKHHDISKYNDDQLLDVINKGMKEMGEKNAFPSRQTKLGVMIEEILEYCKTGKDRPEIIFFDLNGYSENERVPHKYDMVTMFAPDVLMLAGRGFSEDGVDKRAVDVNGEVIADYRELLNSDDFQNTIREVAEKVGDVWERRLT